MLLIRVRERFQIRAVEWVAALITIGMGFWMLIWPSVFDRIGLSGFADLMHPALWMTAAIGIGVARIAALLLNGHWPLLSAPIRMTGAVAGSSFFAAVAAGFAMRSDLDSPAIGIVVFLILAVADLYSATRAAIDTAHAQAGGHA